MISRVKGHVVRSNRQFKYIHNGNTKMDGTILEQRMYPFLDYSSILGW